jgi:hypothetical protein
MKFFLSLLAIVGVVAAIAFVYRMPIPETLGMLGFFIALIKIGYDLVEKELERRGKEEDKRERVTAEISYNPDEHEMEVRVFNPSHSKVVPLEAVQLKCLFGSEENTRWLRTTINNESREAIDLEKRKSAVFTDFSDIVDIERICRLSADNVWISISSHAGEIERIKGERIIPILERMVAEIKGQPHMTKNRPVFTADAANGVPLAR